MTTAPKTPAALDFQLAAVVLAHGVGRKPLESA